MTTRIDIRCPNLAALKLAVEHSRSHSQQDLLRRALVGGQFLRLIEARRTDRQGAGLPQRVPIVHVNDRQPCAGERARDGAARDDDGPSPGQTTLFRPVQRHAASFIAHSEASTGILNISETGSG